MKNKFKIAIIALGSFLLISCNNSFSHEYLLEHPDVLQKELTRCQESGEYTSYCDGVKQAGQEFMALVSARGNDPELFGRQILQAQSELADEKEKLEQLRQEQEQMKGSPATELQDMQKKLDLVKTTYQAKEQKVKVLLAVVAATTSNEL